MDQRDLLAPPFRILAALPFRRADAPIHRFQRQHMRRILDAHAAEVVDLHGIGRIEAHIGADRPVVELAEQQQARIRKHVLDEQGLAPARMGADHVRDEPRLLQLDRRASDALAVQHEAFEIPDIAMGVRAGLPARLIFDLGDAVDVRLALLGDERDLVAGHRRHMRRKMLVLARAILMDEEDVHGGRQTHNAALVGLSGGLRSMRRKWLKAINPAMAKLGRVIYRPAPRQQRTKA